MTRSSNSPSPAAGASAAVNPAVERANAAAARANAGNAAAQQQVRVAQGPAWDPSAIPVALNEYFSGRGLRISQASTEPREVARLASYQRVLLRMEDVPKEDQEMVLLLLREGGYRQKDGHWLRGDTGLFIQPYKQYEAIGIDAFESWRAQQPDPEREAAAIQDVVNGTVVGHGVRVEPMYKQPGDSPIRPV